MDRAGERGLEQHGHAGSEVNAQSRVQRLGHQADESTHARPDRGEEEHASADVVRVDGKPTDGDARQERNSRHTGAAEPNES